jgi:outer membrane protein OmpA-like peptidoglycan-associated protein/uncharacterized protein YidB (DUF937 family)
MASFQDLTDEIAAQFDLGPEADALVQYVLGHIAAERRGVDGFLDKFKNAGLEAEAESWLGGRGGVPLSVRQVKKALGAEVIKEAAKTLGVPQGFASKLLGYAIPRIIGLLTADGAISEAIPTGISIFPGWAHPSLWSSAAGLRSEAQTPQRRVEGDASSFRFVTPATALLITLVLFGYAISSGSTIDHSATVDHSVTVATGGNFAAITGSLKTALGARETTGDLGFQDGIKNSKAELYSSGNTRSRAVLAGKGLNTGEGTGHADNARMIDEGTLESLTIHFPPNSATISSRSLPLVRRVAGMIEELPAGTMVQIDGYTDSAGNPTANMELSQRRADSVDLALIHAGVSPAMLSPKGLGSASLSESFNGTIEALSKTTKPQRNNRRVEFHVAQQHSQ